MDLYCLRIWDLTDDPPRARLTLHTTEGGALAGLYIWIQNHWDDGLMGRSPTGDCAKDALDFFTTMEEEYEYSIEQKIVYGHKVAEEGPFDPEEVPLDPVEVQTTVYALRTAKTVGVGLELGTGSGHASNIVRRIIEKLSA